MEVVGRSLGAECSEQVRNAFNELDALTKSAKSVPALMKMFNVCEFDLNNVKNRQNFFSNLIDDFAGVVQYNEDNRVSVLIVKFLTLYILISLQIRSKSVESQTLGTFRL